ncbi:MAG TPA: cupin domain-containing protein [Gemmatimonadaceae bacterium]|nr:cupin domain-containing protein [Gemmatimonadaceae bacterium]
MRGEPSHRVAHLRPDDLLERLEAAGKERFYAAYRRGQLEVELYAPRGHDPQNPHPRDELYIVVAGSGEFVAGEKGENRYRFAAGDFLFVAAGVPHRFEKFSDDLVVWVVFYGPQGGEKVERA